MHWLSFIDKYVSNIFIDDIKNRYIIIINRQIHLNNNTQVGSYLVFGLQRYQLANSAERKRQSEHFLFRDVGGKLTQVKDPRRDALSALRNTQPISAIHCGQTQRQKQTI